MYWKEEFILNNRTTQRVIKDGKYFDKIPHFIIKLFENIDTLILHKIYKLNDFDNEEFLWKT